MVTLRDTYNSQFTQNAEAYDLISRVNNNIDRDGNLAILLNTGVRKPALIDVVSYLKTNFADKYPNTAENLNPKKLNTTKAQLINQIVDFVASTLPSECLKCSKDYTPFLQDNSAEDGVKCFMCKLPAHIECYKSDDIKFHLVFLCCGCLENSGKSAEVSTITPTKTKAADKHDKSEISASDSSKDEDDEEDSSDEDENERKKQWHLKKKKARKHKSVDDKKKKDQTCPLLIEGICPHGMSGRDCEYEHKKPCHRYCSFGSKEIHRGGCKFGEMCRYLHPKLCQNSVEMKMCLNESCKLAHLKYTKRSRQSYDKAEHSNYKRSDTSAQRDYVPKASYQEKPKYIRREQTTNNYKYNVDNGHEDITMNQQAFLESAMERMQKILSKQIQIQFQKLQGNSYDTDYPAMPNPANQNWNQNW